MVLKKKKKVSKKWNVAKIPKKSLKEIVMNRL